MTFTPGGPDAPHPPHSESEANQARGCSQLFDPDVELAGIILNKVGSPAHAEWLEGSLKTAGCNVPVLGSIPQDLDVQVPEESIGTRTPGRPDAEYANQIAEVCARAHGKLGCMRRRA
jgi:cobyrinic acid a,c-diamide synthase